MEEANTVVPLEAEVTGATSRVRWDVRRATDDSAALGGPGALPTLVPDPNDTKKARLTLDQRGSFIVRAYCDDDYDTNFSQGESARTVKFVMLRARLQVDNSVPQPQNIGTQYAGQGIGREFVPTYGTFNGRANGGCVWVAHIVVTGGGPRGVRGMNRLRAGWINNITALNAVGNYAGGEVVRGVAVSSRTGAALLGQTRYFRNRPAPPATLPALPVLALTLLDTGRQGAGRGGNSALSSRNNRARDGNVPLGRRFRVRSYDSPGISIRVNHPRFQLNANRITSYRLNLSFRVHLCVFTTSNPQTYVTVRSFDWNCTGTWNLNPAANGIAAGGAVAPTIAIANQVTHRPATRAQQGAGCEVRRPRILDAFAFDGR